VAGLSALFSGLAIGLIAYFEHGEVSKAWAAFIAFLCSQVVYFISHPNPVPQTAPEADPTDSTRAPAGAAPGV
jgi:hypothetical protein